MASLNGHEFEQAPGDGGGQGSPACCSPWGHKESDTTDHVVAVLCPTLWDPMDLSMPGLPVRHQLPELAQTHVH